MALLRKLNSRAKTENNTGFGINSTDYGGRFVDKNGRPNIGRTGIGFFERISWYHTMLAMPRWRFLSLIFLFYISANLLFAFVYYFIGVNHLGGVESTSKLEQFGEAYFFSAQTFTTVGYGRINPTGFLASSVAAFEALTGLLSLAVVTGLLYGRFSRPKAFIRFSENALIAPFKDGIALMFRLAPFKKSNLSDAEAKVSLAIAVEENGKMVNKFYALDLELSIINTLNLSWTIVHPITEDSPLYKLIAEDYATIRGEVMVYIKAFDDMFSNTVVSRSSYTFKEVVIGARFVPMYHRSEDGASTILDFEKLNEHIPAAISFPQAATNTAVSV